MSLPRFAILTGSILGDGNGPDAEGVTVSIEWLGFIVEWHFYRRGK